MTAIAIQAPQLRITARGRRALAIVVAAPVLVLAALGALQATTATAGLEASTVVHESIVVQPGETLWSIASAVAPDADPREVIADIQSLNDIGGAIQPGQQLAIPAEYTR
ncbi:LysM peptidoglycan-binding domain-containing protein [Agrococcus jejuensis]|uniref:LysM domain-containing protein n=1 Tax=Agrococcus jejuensis TaxID=399736 RepID=A0A1G8ALU2_9MICO|nr:LysM peptidoglycan-binding domain-containing protein [Agrococcus jejuensis]SDH21931.1 LysM domain-containing protein [Agrococcus jejuensis]